MLTTNNKKRYQEIKKIIAHGINKNKKKNFWNRVADLPGHNYRLPNHLASLGVSQLSKLNEFNNKRLLIAKKYDVFFRKFQDIFTIQKINPNLTHYYQMYSILVKQKYKNKLLHCLKKNGIEASVHFDPPLHMQKYLKNFTKKLINTEILAKQIVTLPIYPLLKTTEQNKIFKVIRNWYKKKKL